MEKNTKQESQIKLPVAALKANPNTENYKEDF